MNTIHKKCSHCGNNVDITLITTVEAGKLTSGHSITNQSILRHIKSGKLPATKPGKEWLIQPEDLKLIADRKPGNPHKKK